MRTRQIQETPVRTSNVSNFYCKGVALVEIITKLELHSASIRPSEQVRFNECHAKPALPERLEEGSVRVHANVLIFRRCHRHRFKT